MFAINNTISAVIIGLSIGSALVFGIATQALKKQNQLLKKDNQRVVAELKTLQANYQLTEEAYNALSATKLQIRKQKQRVITRLQDAPKRDDAAVAPVLRQALEAIE